MIVVNRLGGAAGVGSLGYNSSESAIRWAKEQLSLLGYWEGGTFTGAENSNFNAAVSAFQMQWNTESRTYTVDEAVPRRCTNVRRGETIATLDVEGDFGCRTGYALAAASAHSWAHAPAGFERLSDGGARTGNPDCRRDCTPCLPSGLIPANCPGGTGTDPDTGMDAPPVAGGSWWSKWWWTLPAAASAVGGGYLVLRSRRQQAVAMAGFRRRRRR